jgi:flagellar basal-body rod protein FlgB
MKNTSQLLEGAMRWWSARGNLVASNVARADIPGEKSRDFAQTLADQTQKPLPQPLLMAATDARHLAARRSDAEQTGRLANERNIVTINENQISVEDEMVKLAEIGAQHQLASTVYRKNVGLLKTILRGGRG